MLSLFRRGLSSWLVLGFFGFVLVALVVTGVGTPGSMGDLGASTNGEHLASAGRQRIGTNDVSQRLQMQLENLRQEQPGLDIASLIRDGAVEQIVNGLVDTRAVQDFANRNGIHISQRMIDAKIAEVDAFKGLGGTFDRNRFEEMLQNRNMTERQLRGDIERDLLVGLLGGPVGAVARPPMGLVGPFAGLMLETRHGVVASVPSALFGAGKPPTDAELKTFYDRNAARYTVPEMRTVRYALFDRSRFEGKIQPSEAEIAAYFKKNAALYAGKETRGLTQVIVQSQSVASEIAAKVKAGGDISAAAKAAGVEALKIDPLEKSAYAGMSAAAVADTVFAGPSGSVVGPAKSGLGWHVVRIDSVTASAGKSLDQARGEIAPLLAKQKVADAEADFIDRLENAVDDGQTFDEIAKANGLSVVVTPKITASGLSPEAPGYTAPAQLATILKEAFQAEEEDDATVLTINDAEHALVDLQTIYAAAAPPLVTIKDTVARDFAADRASRETRKIADAIAKSVNGGTVLTAAIAATGQKIGSPAPVSARRAEVLQAGNKAPPPLSALFNLRARQARVLPAPDSKGWYVVLLERVEPGKASTSPQLMIAAQQQLGGVLATEYNQQFMSAIKAEIGASTDKAAIARLKKSLGGGGR